MRLTEKTTAGYLCRTMNSNPIQKLGQLEDIEEYIKKGVWYAFGGNVTYFDKIVTDMKQIGIVYDRGIMWIDLKDYGKTWALTKEELLNG